MAKKKLLQDSEGQIWPITTADCVYLADGSKTVKKYIDDALSGKSDTGHTHNAIASRGNVTCESGVTARPAVAGLSMTHAYNNGYPTAYGNVINLRGTGDGQILVGWSGTDGAHAPVYVRSKRDNTTTANWSGWAQVYTTAHKPTAADIGAAASGHTHNYAGSSSAGGAATSALACTGNSVSATKLATARKINGMVFDGTQDITTNWWGSARDLTIGKKTQSVNGSGNVSWTLSDIMGRASLSSSTDANANKFTKFARVDVSGSTYRCCSGTFDFVPSEGSSMFGQLSYYLRTNNTITSTSIVLLWKTLNNTNYANSVVAVKVSDGVYDLYFKPINTWDTMTVTNINSVGIGYITLYSNQGFVNSVTAAATSSLGNHATTAAKLTTARNITIGNKTNSFDGSGNISFSLADIGAAATHSHPYLPTAGGTMTGKITTPNNAAGITIGDDVTICDRNVANFMVLEGSTATSGGIIFGSGKDTNIYRGGENVLKTDDAFHAVSVTVSDRYYMSSSVGQSQLGVGDTDCYWYNKQANKYFQFKNDGRICLSDNELYHRGHNTIDVADRSSGDSGFGNSNRPCGFIGRFPGWSSSCLYINTYSNSGAESKSYNDVKIKGNNVYIDGAMRCSSCYISNRRITIADSAPSSPATGDIWIDT